MKSFSKIHFPIIATFTLLAFTSLNAEIKVETNVSYLPKDRTETMDIYLPDKRIKRPLPAMLLIHGGGWLVGDKASSREKNIAYTLSNSGYAVFSINYLLNERDENRTITKLAWPQNVIDCKSALRFIRAHANDYGIDPNRIGVIGGSAGGHLSMMLAATAENPKWNEQGEHLNENNGVRCIVNLYGPADVRNRTVNPFSGSDKSLAEHYEVEASPVTYFNSKLPPMLILQGTADRTIPVEQTRELVETLDEVGTQYCYIEISGAPHSFDLQPKQMDLRPVVLSFLDKHLKQPAK